MNHLKDLLPIDTTGDGAEIFEALNNVLAKLCESDNHDVLLRNYSRSIIIALAYYETDGLDICIEKLNKLGDK